MRFLQRKQRWGYNLGVRAGGWNWMALNLPKEGIYTPLPFSGNDALAMRGAGNRGHRELLSK